MTQIHFRYEPEVSRFWLGAKNDFCYQEYGLQHWMSVEDVIKILREAEKEINLR